MGFDLLTAVIFLPFVAGIACFLLGDAAAKSTALVASLVTFAASLGLWTGYDPLSDVVYQLGVERAWIPDLGIRYAVGLDGIALLLVMLTTFMMPLVVLSATPAVERKVGQYLGWMLVLEGAMIGTFAATDVFLFYVFWELMLIPMYFLIGIWGGENRLYATIKFFIYTMAGSVLMLVAILAMFWFHQDQTGTWSASVTALGQVELLPATQTWLFAAFALAFAIKVPMFPVHTWLPDAHVQAPTGGSVVLAGVLLKMGTFGFLRYAIPFFPDAAIAAGPLLIGLAVVGIVYGALVAMVQDDVKKLVAYSSVSHMGVVVLGIFAFNSAGISGAVYQMLGHGLSTGALFLLVGILYERRHTKKIVEYGGLSKVMPRFAFVLSVVTFASIGLPGLNGFVGEFLVLLGAFQHAMVPAIVATTGVILGAVYMLWMFQRVMFGPLTNAANKDLPDLTARELAYLTPILFFIVLMGVWPQPFLEVMAPSVERVVDLLAAHHDGAPYAAMTGGR